MYFTLTVSLTVTLSFTLTATDAMLSDAMRCFYRYPMLYAMFKTISSASSKVILFY